MNMTDIELAPKPGPVTEVFWKLASVDMETMRRCPEADWSNVKAVGEINLFAFLYMTGLFSLIFHRLYAAPGQIRPEFIALAAFLGAFLISIDTFMINRSGWYLSGVSELKKGGLDISGGPGARLKAACFLTIRILLSVGIAQLTGIFVSLCIFAGDINARQQNMYNHDNAGLIANMAAIVDARIQQASEAVAKENVRYAGLAAQVESVRQNEIDPASGNPLVQQAQHELSQLLTQKAKADDAVRQAEAFETNELGGAKGDGHSGRAGDGPRHRAAVEATKNARNHAQEIDRSVDAVRTRLDKTRDQLLATGGQGNKQVATQVADFESMLKAEQTKLAEMQSQLDQLTRNRDVTIHEMVENAPGHVSLNQGLLAQITALEELAQNDSKITLLIVLIDLTSFGFELAAVLVKITCYVPTTYAALLVRDVYLRNVRIAEEMMDELDGKHPSAEGEEQDDPSSQDGPDADSPSPAGNGGQTAVSGLTSPFATAAASTIGMKRPRGRPRKVPVTH